MYIQGDKQTPFYVKLEGAMQERYGKNYCIMSQLAPGPAHLEILFQQNAYPAQQFTIQVPEGGARGFLLMQRNGAFSLYDLQQQFYIPAGNKEEDDHLPLNGTIAVSTNELIPAEATPVPEDITRPVKQREKVAEKEKTNRHYKEKALEKAEVKASDDPQFLQKIELNNSNSKLASTPVLSNDNGFAPPVNLAPTFRNSDCPAAMDSVVFEHLYKQMMAKSTDEDRINFLSGQLDKCYLTWHARTLGTMLTEDAARYTFLKKVYPRITDQQNFPLMDDMLRSEVWKAQFSQLIHP